MLTHLKIRDLAIVSLLVRAAQLLVARSGDDASAQKRRGIRPACAANRPARTAWRMAAC